MGFLDRFLGNEMSAPEIELARKLGADPEQMRRSARRNSMMQLGGALLGADGRNGVQRTGRALAAYNAGGGGMAPEMERVISAFNMRSAIDQMTAQKAQQEAMQKWANSAEKPAGIPENVWGIVQEAAKLQRWDIVDSAMKEATKYRAPVSVAGGSFTQRAALKLFGTADESQLTPEQKMHAAEEGQRMSLERAATGADKGTTVILPGPKEFSKRSGTKFADFVADLQTSALATSNYADSVGAIDATLGEDPPENSMVLAGKEIASQIPGIANFVDKEKLGRQQAARSDMEDLTLQNLMKLKGATSDRDYATVQRIAPRLQTTREGRQLLVQFAQAKAQQRMKVAQYANTIADQVDEGTISLEQARAKILEYNDKTQISPQYEKIMEKYTGGAKAPAKAGASGGTGDPLIDKYL